MPPVFGPSVVVEDALVILRRADRHRARAVAEREERHLGPDEALLDDEARARGAELLLLHHRRGSRRRPRRDRGATTTPLPAASPSAFTRRESRTRPTRSTAQRLGRRLAHAIARGRNAVARHEALREDLAALELRRGARRAEDARPARAETIDDAAIERKLRSDDGEIDRARARPASSSASDRATSIGIDARDARDAGVAGRAGDCGHAERSRESFQASACSRPPAPTTRTFMRPRVKVQAQLSS